VTEFIPQYPLEDVILVKPQRHGDSRGYFSEVFHAARFAENGIGCTFVQDNHSMSAKKNVLRGLHFQTLPDPQDKLVRCTRGRILDVAVDIRHGSPTFGQYVAVELSAQNGWQLFVPVGFAHAFCTREENSEVQYKVSGHYSPECDAGLAFDDPDLQIDWQVPVADLVLSDKDKDHPRLQDMPVYFEYGKL